MGSCCSIQEEAKSEKEKSTIPENQEDHHEPVEKVEKQQQQQQSSDPSQRSPQIKNQEIDFASHNSRNIKNETKDSSVSQTPLEKEIEEYLKRIEKLHQTRTSISPDRRSIPSSTISSSPVSKKDNAIFCKCENENVTLTELFQAGTYFGMEKVVFSSAKHKDLFSTKAVVANQVAVAKDDEETSRSIEIVGNFLFVIILPSTKIESFIYLKGCTMREEVESNNNNSNEEKNSFVFSYLLESQPSPKGGQGHSGPRTRIQVTFHGKDGESSDSGKHVGDVIDHFEDLIEDISIGKQFVPSKECREEIKKQFGGKNAFVIRN